MTLRFQSWLKPSVLMLLTCLCAAQENRTDMSPMQELQQAMERAKSRPVSMTRLTESDRAKLATLTGTDDYQNGPNSIIRAHYLPNGHVLFASHRASDNCVSVKVFRRTGLARREFEEAWSAGAAPSGTPFCSPSFCRAPSVFAAFPTHADADSTSSTFSVNIPRQLTPEDSYCRAKLEVKYELQKGKYIALGETLGPEDHSLYCQPAADREELGSEGIILVRFVGSLSRRQFGVRIVKRNEKLLTEKYDIGPDEFVGGVRDAGECSFSPHHPYKDVGLEDAQLRQLLDEFNGIDLRTGRCVRDRKSNECRYFTDPAVIRVYVSGQPPISLFHLRNSKDVRDQNSVLHGWALKLFTAAGFSVR